MAEFSELIKSMDRVRAYLRDFYLFGWRTRAEYPERTVKSPRSYDNERRRIENWLGKHVRKSRVEKGYSVSISIDVARTPRNPLYEVWRTKSFTRNDLLLHFFLLDITADGSRFSTEAATDEMLARFGVLFDASTVRKKLNEYRRLGLLDSAQCGRRRTYYRSPVSWNDMPPELSAAVDFFTEVAPFGVVGSFLQDLRGSGDDCFRFKHHFAVHTLEDGVLLEIVRAMREKRQVLLRTKGGRQVGGVPLKVLVSRQGGRRYVVLGGARFHTERLDAVESVEIGEAAVDYEELEAEFVAARGWSWGVVLKRHGQSSPERVELTLRIDEAREGYVLERLNREGRHGTVERVAENTFVYRIEVWESAELLPFVKSFTGRIVSFRCGDRRTKKRLYDDLERMWALYGEEGERGDDAQE